MRTRNITIAALAAVTFLAACGSDSKGATDTSAAASTTAAGATDTTAGATESTSANTIKATGEHADEEFCTFQEDLNNTSSPLSSSTAPTADEMKKFITETVRPSIQKLTDTAPDEMAADAATMAEAYGKLSDLFEKNDFDITKALADPDSAALNSQAYSEANSRIEAYCGFNAG